MRKCIRDIHLQSTYHLTSCCQLTIMGNTASLPTSTPCRPGFDAVSVFTDGKTITICEPSTIASYARSATLPSATQVVHTRPTLPSLVCPRGTSLHDTDVFGEIVPLCYATQPRVLKMDQECDVDEKSTVLYYDNGVKPVKLCY